MILPTLPNWIQDPLSKLWHQISERIWTTIEDMIIRVFKSARIAHTTQTGLEILWEDVPVKVPVAEDLKRAFMQNYDRFMDTVGIKKSDELIPDFFNLTYFDSIDMRDHPQFSHLYPFQVIRFYLHPEGAVLIPQLNQFLPIVVPARCSKHFHFLIIHGTGMCRKQLTRKFPRR